MTNFSKPFSIDNGIEIKRLETALEAACIGTWELDLIHNHFRVCNRFKTIFGYEFNDIAPFEEVLSQIHHNDRERVRLECKRTLEPGFDHEFDIDFQAIESANENSRWINFRGQAHLNEEGQPIRLSGIAANVTKNVLARLALENSSSQLQFREAELRSLIENTPDVIMRWNKDLTLTFANEALEVRTGVPNSAVLGKTYQQMDQPEDLALFYIRELQSVFELGQQREYHHKFHTKNRSVSFYTRLIPEFGSDGAVISVLALARDVTEQFVSESRFQTMIEQAPMAIGLLRSREMIIEAGNDRIFEIWGKEKSVIGKRIVEALPEIESQVFIQLLENVYDTGEPFTGNEIKATLVRNGKMQDVYLDFVYTPLRNPNGKITGVMIMAVEATEQVIARKSLEESETKFRTLIEEAPIATCLFKGRNLIIELANETMINYWGKDNSVIGKPLQEAVPELIGQPFLDILNDVFVTGKTYEAKDMHAKLESAGVLNTYYFDFTYKPLRNDSGEVYGIMEIAVDVTQRVIAQKALAESESRLRSVVASAPAAMALFVGRDLVVEMPNQAFIDIVGKGPDVAGKPLKQVMPELENQAYLQILDNVYTSGVMYQSFGTQVDIVRQGVMTNNFYNITYTPLQNSEGNVYAILDIAIDVTERVIAQQQIEESRLQLLSSFEQSPVAVAIIGKAGLVFQMANPFYGDLVGRKPEQLVGKSLLEALPELSGQGFDNLLNEVIETGIPYTSKEQVVNITRNNRLETIYVDLTYQPQREKNDDISGVLVVASDVTRQVLSRKKIEEAESNLRGAVELAKLGTWEINLTTKILDYSPRLREWFGIGEDEIITIEKGYLSVSELERPLIKEAITFALTRGTSGIFDVEFAVNTDQERILHAQGKTFYNDQGEAFKISGTVQDVTEQRKVRIDLEKQVQQRTEELEAINEELAAINEEYLATNEELTQSNELLTRSNENLQQFAYVASHDLQEPLRKIQSFGDLLRRRFPDDLGEGANYLQRMQSAARRMSALIEDLLTFSRVSSKQDATISVSLANVVQAVLTDLELTVQETGAVISIGSLPTINGDQLQLGQLFQNLISNALKFRRIDILPRIDINSQLISASELPENVKPAQTSAAYHRIDVSDDGIGFDNMHATRIFQIFQRLHGRSEYVGTGIGLAICEKVAINHGGAITAVSEVGSGTTFSVYFPA